MASFYTLVGSVRLDLAYLNSVFKYIQEGLDGV